MNQRRQSGMNHDEKLARRVVSAVSPEWDLTFNDDQSTSVADISISRSDEEIGALEVTRFTDSGGEEIRSILRKKWFVKRTLCKSDWLIHMDDNATVNNVNEQVDQYLRQIEEAGLDDFFGPMHAKHEPVRRIWNDLRVEAGRKTQWKQSGIGIMAPSSGGWADSESVWGEVRSEVYKSDNRNKLGRSNGSIRHLFVVIDGLQGLAYSSMTFCKPPRETPDLPPEITHLWLAAEEGALVYVWLADSDGWRNLTNLVNGDTSKRLSEYRDEEVVIDRKGSDEPVLW